MKNFGNCEQVRKDSKIVITDPGSKNNRSKFRLDNQKKLQIRVIQVDDCVIKQGMRCDYLVITPSTNQFPDGQEIYIELKGSDVRHAVEQIAISMQKLTDNMSLSKLCFIASTRCLINSTEIQNIKKKFKQKYKAKLIIKNGEITHKV
ncbi:MAG: hypothetical protein QNJ60_03270 [Xenococcaceae cyanobacterium MO_188.B19]|nr:hypothetical protein [Xenococcaceae cyanobacterium MO_188.B19]